MMRGALLLAVALAGCGGRQPELELDGPGDTAQLELVRVATIDSAEHWGFGRDSLELRLSDTLVVVEELPDGRRWDDSYFFSADDFLSRIRCREPGGGRNVIKVSRGDFAFSELPLQLVFVLTGCDPDRSWWDSQNLNEAAADAMNLSRERVLTGANGGSR